MAPLKREDVLAKVQLIVGDFLNYGVDEVKPESKLYEDLGADSLDVVEIVMALEEEFDLNFDALPDEVHKDGITIAEVVDHIQKLKES